MNETNKDQTIFYNIYSNGEKRAGASKEYTGLFFFRGEQDAPFAIVCAGGGFAFLEKHIPETASPPIEKPADHKWHCKEEVQI
jgi:hypothetical protein